nr:hypothetical protein [uncultured bacterium]
MGFIWVFFFLLNIQFGDTTSYHHTYLTYSPQYFFIWRWLMSPEKMKRKWVGFFYCLVGLSFYFFLL